MLSISLLTSLTNDAVIYALCSSLAFLVGYGLTAPWWRSQIGWALMTLDAGLVLALLPSVLHRFIGFSVTELWFAYYYLATLLLVGTATAWRAWITIRAQWSRRHCTPEEVTAAHEAAAVPKGDPDAGI